MVATWNKSDVSSAMAVEGFDWRFNPPGAPHFGGVWERLVRSCKKAMFFILSNRVVTPEVLETVLTLVEQTLNARPITPVSSDPSDLEALTPNHFLLGRSTNALPMYDASATGIPLKKLYKQSEAIANEVWTRWLKEYLPTINGRSKWSKSTETIRVGDLVWLVDPTLKRGLYLMGRVSSVRCGDDGVVRSATLQTKMGSYTRPIVKLVPVIGDVP